MQEFNRCERRSFKTTFLDHSRCPRCSEILYLKFCIASIALCPALKVRSKWTVAQRTETCHMVSIAAIRSEVELLAQQCLFLFSESQTDQQIDWQHSSVCPALAGLACVCNAGIMTRKQMERFDTKLQECSSCENDDHSIRVKLSNFTRRGNNRS